jgi:hypothetical protein
VVSMFSWAPRAGVQRSCHLDILAQ